MFVLPQTVPSNPCSPPKIRIRTSKTGSVSALVHSASNHSCCHHTTSSTSCPVQLFFSFPAFISNGNKRFTIINLWHFPTYQRSELSLWICGDWRINERVTEHKKSYKECMCCFSSVTSPAGVQRMFSNLGPRRAAWCGLWQRKKARTFRHPFF